MPTSGTSTALLFTGIICFRAPNQVHVVIRVQIPRTFSSARGSDSSLKLAGADAGPLTVRSPNRQAILFPGATIDNTD